MSKPVAVIINDIHYSLNTLEVADTAMNTAIGKANELGVTLVVAGDLHDTKANIRGECINAMQKTFARAETAVFILRGNHDAINEKSQDHSLNFLATFAEIIDKPTKLSAVQATFGDPGILIPYHHDPEELRAYLKPLPEGSRLIMHQGIEGSNAGHYILDKSAISKEDVKDFRVISGHYHQRQDIKTGRPRKGALGLWTYTGNPYTLNFGEANDPEKGFHVLYDDGLLEFCPTNLRKHVILNCKYEDSDGDGKFNILSLPSTNHIKANDIVWVKVKGPKESLKISMTNSKKNLAGLLGLSQDFKLDLIADEIKTEIEQPVNLSQPELLDSLIASLTNVSEEQKKRLKTIWKDLAE